MNVTVKLFGQIVDVAGSNSIQVDNVSNTDELIQQLQLKYPALINSNYRVAVNRNIIQSNTVFQQNAEVALLPPFSGG
jgi:molybdopterin converting factor small subunit